MVYYFVWFDLYAITLIFKDFIMPLFDTIISTWMIRKNLSALSHQSCRQKISISGNSRKTSSSPSKINNPINSYQAILTSSEVFFILSRIQRNLSQDILSLSTRTLPLQFLTTKSSKYLEMSETRCPGKNQNRTLRNHLRLSWRWDEKEDCRYYWFFDGSE